MSAVDELLHAGDLDGARAALVEAVRAAPQDQGARMFLWQLMAVSGEWDKAAIHLRTLASLSPEAQMLATVYHQAMAAEAERAQAFAGKRPFPVLMGGGGWIDDLSAALADFAQGRHAEGEQRRDRAFDAAPSSSGEIDGRAFEWVADADARFGPALEAIINGKWGLVPIDVISQIDFEGPKDLRDLIWAPAQVRFRAGQSAAVLFPARYPGSEAGSPSVRLGRETTWRDGPSGQEGLGQRVLSFSEGEDVGILSAQRLTLA